MSRSRGAGRKRRTVRSVVGALVVGAGVSFVGIAGAQAMSLREAIDNALRTNPQIGASIENREAVEFELRQAQGLFLPQADIEASAGVRQLDSPGRRLAGTGRDTLNPFDISFVVTQRLFDGFEARSRVERQAARVDGASFRVLERSEFIALQIAREYFDVLLQARIVQLARENVATHERILNDIRDAEREGTLTAADTQQAQERVFANRARLIEAQEELEAARARFLTLVGVPLDRPQMPGSVGAQIPRTLDQAIEVARAGNPTLLASRAAVDAADAARREVQSGFMPQVFLEGRARTGNDIDGNADRTTDLQARVVMRMNVFNGGATSAAVQEQIRRAGEERFRMHQSFREVEEAVRLSWDRRRFQSQLLSELDSQLSFSDRIVVSYEEQFQVGRRSLLDVLDAYNTRYNVRVVNESARYAIRFAEYRLLAAMGRLVDSLSLTAPQQAVAYAREEYAVPAAPAVDDAERTPPRNPFR